MRSGALVLCGWGSGLGDVIRDVKNWEQGRASLNAQAAILIRMAEHYPDTVERLTLI